MNIGRIGVWTANRFLGDDNLAPAAELAESLGYGALWLGYSPRLPELRPALAATERITVATGIANVWEYDPSELAAEHAELSLEFPGRIRTGTGIGHPELKIAYTKPVTAMRNFLGLTSAPTPIPRNEMCIAALGPKLLDLAAERTLGAHTYFVPPEHTAFARRQLERRAAPRARGRVRGRRGSRSGQGYRPRLRQELSQPR
jgi:probable F420-dependent oxidoreductase